MDEAQYQQEIDDIFVDVEDAIDETDLDVDVDSSGGILTVTFEDGSAIILSRQPAARELWVAAKSGGFHLSKVDDVWQCGTTGESLQVLLNRTFTEQSGMEVSLLD